MRLKVLDQRFAGMDIPDMVRAVTHRPELFGDPLSESIEELLRGSSAWSVAERELMVAFVSSANQCPFCAGSHAAVASLAAEDEPLVTATLNDVDTAPISEPLRATLKMLAKLTREPQAFGPNDIDVVRRHGVADDAIRDAICVAGHYNTINRVVDSLGFAVAEDQYIEARILLQFGYANIPDFDKIMAGSTDSPPPSTNAPG